jgi:TonB family protein
MPTIPGEDNKVEVSGAAPVETVDRKQRQRMLMALAVLVIALVVVLVRDHEFLSSPSSQTAAPSAAAPAASAPSTPSPAEPSPAATQAGPAVSQAPAPQPAPTSKSKSKKNHKQKAAANPTASASTPTAEVAAATSPDTNGPVITATNRTVLPPLQVEVVAGNQHRSLPSRSNSVKVEMDSSNTTPTPSPDSARNAATPPADQTGDTATPSAAMVPTQSPRVTLSPDTQQHVSRSVEPDYPLLAKQMKVQGAVVLQVLIDRSGSIQELHVVSGPTILASAAQQALKQWHFKPYYQNGQPVETEARVTVNFTISTY